MNRKNLGYYAFWGAAYVLLLWTTIRWLNWATSLVAGDPEFQADSFQRLAVAFGWTFMLLLIGVAKSCTEKNA